jgi:hypothetical protein
MSIYVRRKTTAEVLGDRAEHDITEDYLQRRMAEQREGIMAAMGRAQGWRMDWSPQALNRLREHVREVDWRVEVLHELTAKFVRLQRG